MLAEARDLGFPGTGFAGGELNSSPPEEQYAFLTIYLVLKFTYLFFYCMESYFSFGPASRTVAMLLSFEVW